MLKRKIKKLPQLRKIIAACKKRKKKVVFTNGCFDILHLGHVLYLERAARLGDRLIVAINSDNSVRRIKGPQRPVTAVRTRCCVVAALECVDYVIVFSQPTPLQLIKALKPDILVKGGDYRAGDIVGSKFVRSYGGRIKSIGLIRGYSTSSIISRIKKRK